MAQDFWQSVITIACIAVITLITRALPFLIFPENKPTPKAIIYIGKVLPPAIIGMLVIYCFKDINFFVAPFGYKEIVSAITVAVLHILFKKNFISIGCGTALYVVLMTFC